MAFLESVEQVVDGGRGEKIFLLKAEFPTLYDVVRRVEDLGDVLRYHLLLDSPDVFPLIEIVEIEFPGGFGAPEAERVDGRVAVAGNGGIVGHCHNVFGIDPFITFLPSDGDLDHPSVELYRMEVLLPVQLPGVPVPEPVVRDLLLRAIDDFLTEDAVFIPDAVAVGGDGHGGHGVQKTGSEPTEPAVAEAGILLLVAQVIEVVAERRYCLP